MRSAAIQPAIVAEDKSESLDIVNSLGLPRDSSINAIPPSLETPTPLNHLTQPILRASITVCTQLQPRSDFVAAENAAEGILAPFRLRFEGRNFNDARTDCNVTLTN